MIELFLGWGGPGPQGAGEEKGPRGDGGQQEEEEGWGFSSRLKLARVAAECPAPLPGSDLCHRHRYAADAKDLPPLVQGVQQRTPCDLLDTRWAPVVSISDNDPFFGLARDFGGLDLEGQKAAKVLLKDADCKCPGFLASNMGILDDPAETSDALLVLEGLESEADSMDTNSCSEEDFNSPCRGFWINGKNELQKMGTFSSGFSGQRADRLVGDCVTCADPNACCGMGGCLEVGGGAGEATEDAHCAEGRGLEQNCPSQNELPAASLELPPPPFPLQDFTKPRVGRCASSPGCMAASAVTVASAFAAAVKDNDPKSSRPLKSRKGSLKIRLSKLFRTRSCSSSNEAVEKRHSVDLPTSAGSLTDMCGSNDRVTDLGRKPRLTRTQSAFSPVSFTPVFTGETVSLVDVDISRRGPPSAHPPTPPPPPRRSLSLLDDINGSQLGSVLVSPVGSSLQSLPLPPPPPPHAPMQHGFSLSDTFLRSTLQGRHVETQPAQTLSQPNQQLHVPLSRQDSNSFAASLRELEKCGWYWGPMNWEDAEMKLKGKPDGSFLVRDSSDPRYILSLSFRSQGITHHTRMEHYRGTFSLWCHPKFEDRCQSVVEFIERAIMHSKHGKFLYFLRSRVPGLPPTPVQLLYPVSRFSNVKSLQHLCRFRIRQLVRIDHIPELPLPKPLISYLRKFYYYDPEEEMYLSLKEARQRLKQEVDSEAQT
nr:PREDICTED: suppressor of cytokine signaling 7 [Latimeria chalumnae]|eukprot:XP_005990139.1 PREDICTED: suppressor of cytokine signaling 7 [Latimeria chalumnae]